MKVKTNFGGVRRDSGYYNAITVLLGKPDGGNAHTPEPRKALQKRSYRYSTYCTHHRSEPRARLDQREREIPFVYISSWKHCYHTNHVHIAPRQRETTTTLTTNQPWVESHQRALDTKTIKPLKLCQPLRPSPPPKKKKEPSPDQGLPQHPSNLPSAHPVPTQRLRWA